MSKYQDYEIMADGYKAPLFLWDTDSEAHHLIQCECWICDYRRQLSHDNNCYEYSDIGNFNRGHYSYHYNPYRNEGFFR